MMVVGAMRYEETDQVVGRREGCPSSNDMLSRFSHKVSE